MGNQRDGTRRRRGRKRVLPLKPKGKKGKRESLSVVEEETNKEKEEMTTVIRSNDNSLWASGGGSPVRTIFKA